MDGCSTLGLLFFPVSTLISTVLSAGSCLIICLCVLNLYLFYVLYYNPGLKVGTKGERTRNILHKFNCLFTVNKHPPTPTKKKKNQMWVMQ